MKISPRRQWIALGLILLFALVLRLKGINNPIIDHPGWRQGDEAAIARNFAFVDPNPLHPQADYNGPGPNYVELELQIVPYLASLAYSLFGVHEIFGRLISIAASLGTIGVLFAFGRWLFMSPLAGLTAALFFAIAPGSIYYGRTFQPDTMMTLFLTWALYVGTRSIVEDEERAWRGTLATTALVLMAILAKSVAFLLFIPLVAIMIGRYGLVKALQRPQHWVILVGSIVPFWLYDHYLRSIATWRWASGITTLHVLPSLARALTSPSAMLTKIGHFVDATLMLAHTMLGPVLFTLLILGFLTPLRSRSRLLLVSWLAAGLMYTFVVVTVEQVDYYLYPFIPLAALTGGAYLAAALDATRWSEIPTIARVIAASGLAAALALTILESRREIAPYYQYSGTVMHNTRVLHRILPRDTMIVLGHLDPGVLYYIDRRGWQEDPLLWSVYDEQSAIRKGARYFIVAEPLRLARNPELATWLSRFPVLATGPHTWRVYITDPALASAKAETTWRKAHAGRKHHMHVVKQHIHLHSLHHSRTRPLAPIAQPTLGF